MIIEIPFTLAFLYPALTYFWLYPKLKPVVEKEVEHEQQEMDGVEMEGYNMVSIDRMKTLLSKHISKDRKKEYSNFFQIKNKADSKLSHAGTGYVKTVIDFAETVGYYNIPADRFAVNLPLKVDYYNYKNGFYIHKSGYIASNKDKLVKEILWHKRLPLTMTIPAIAGFCLALLWSEFASETSQRTIGDMYDYDRYNFPSYSCRSVCYPPFHYKRIEGYFTKAKTSNG